MEKTRAIQRPAGKSGRVSLLAATRAAKVVKRAAVKKAAAKKAKKR